MTHGRTDREPAGLAARDWQLMIQIALKRFVCEPEWSEWDFITRIITGHARPIKKDPNDGRTNTR